MSLDLDATEKPYINPKVRATTLSLDRSPYLLGGFITKRQLNFPLALGTEPLKIGYSP